MISDSLPPSHPDALALELAFGEAGGSFLVAGVPPPPVLAALAATASGVTLVARGRRAREAVRWIESVAPCWAQVAPVSGDGLPEIEESHHNALVWELPRSEPVAALERILFSVADEGRVWLSIERHGGVDGKLERLLRSACDEGVVVPPHGPAERLVLEGLRRAPYPASLEDEAPEALPLDVILVTRGREAGLEESLIDLFLRQNYPPRRVLVMDVGAGPEPVPDDLLGIAGQSPVEAVLVPVGAVGLAAAVNEALGGIEMPFVSIQRPGRRLAPNHLAALGLALEAKESWAAVVGTWAGPGSAGGRVALHAAPASGPSEWLRPLLENGPPPLEAALFRTTDLRRLRGLDPERGEGAVNELWLRLAATRELGTLGLPVSFVPEPESRGGPPGLAWLREEISLARLGASFPEVAPRDREVAALRLRAGAARIAGDAAGAARDYEAALERDPEDPAARDGWLAASLEAGRWERILELSPELKRRAPEATTPRLAASRALVRLGRLDEAEQELDQLLDLATPCPMARFGRLVLHLREDRAGLSLLAPLAMAAADAEGAEDPVFCIGETDLRA